METEKSKGETDMKRKLAGILMIICVTAALAGCGRKDQPETQEGTEAGTVAGTEAGTTAGTGEGTAAGTEAGTQPAAGDGTGEAGQLALSDIRDAVAEAYGENYLPSERLDAEMLAAMYGVTEDMYEEMLAEVPMISAQVDTLIIVKAKSDRVEDVKTTLEGYRTYQLEEGLNYPMNVPKIEAAEVLVYGDYVFYLSLGTIDDSIEDEAEMLTAFQEQNEIGKNVIEGILAQ